MSLVHLLPLTFWACGGRGIEQYAWGRVESQRGCLMFRCVWLLCTKTLAHLDSFSHSTLVCNASADNRFFFFPMTTKKTQSSGQIPYCISYCVQQWLLSYRFEGRILTQKHTCVEPNVLVMVDGLLGSPAPRWLMFKPKTHHSQRYTVYDWGQTAPCGVLKNNCLEPL